MGAGSSSREAHQVLAAVSYFADLDAQSFETVLESAVLRKVDPGQLVILEGEPAAGLFVVRSGWLKVSKIALDGREQILHFLGSGEAFNAVSVFTGAPNQASVTALETTTLWTIARAVMLDLLDDNPRLARHIIQDLAGRVTHLISMVEDLSLRTVEARLARLLLEQSTGETIRRQKWATQTEIAARLGTVPDVVSRTLRKLAGQGVIRIGRKEILILDRPRLEMIAMVDG